MDRLARWSPRPRLLCLIGIAVACLLSGAAEARVFVLRADGTGDVPTFQAGVDSINARPSAWDSDTLMVEPGDYDEDVGAVGGAARWVIVCPGGSERTALRSLRIAGRHSIRVEGLTISGSTTVEAIPPRFVGCTFKGPVSVRTDRHAWLTRCTFRDRTDLHMSGTVDSSRFEGTARIRPNDDPITLRRCVLAGPDTAAHAGGGPYAVRFDFCVFSDVNRAIVLAPYFDKVLVESCHFRDVRGAAISYDGPLGDYGQHRLEVVNTRFERCGGAVSVQAGAAAHISRRLWLALSGSTVVDSRSTGVDLAGLVVPQVMGCIIIGSAADGVRIELVQGAYGDPSAVVSGNTFAFNVGAGLHVLGEQPADEFSDPVRAERNILAGNRCPGIYVEAPARVISLHNVAWMNEGGGNVGPFEAEDNLTRDPQFCDPLAGDFRLTASSPCAPSGPFGQIGALGVGCDVSTIPIQIRAGSGPHPIPAGSKGVVPVALLSHRLFDARQVDPASIRLAGATVVTKPPLQQRDVDGDGFADLVAFVDAGRMDLPAGTTTATLEASTFYGAPLRGSDEVRVVPARAQAGAATSMAGPAAARLAIDRVRVDGAHLLVSFTLPGAEPATLELFDVAGRRVSTRPVAGGPTREATLKTPGAGVYWLRLAQGARAMTKRTVVTR